MENLVVYFRQGYNCLSLYLDNQGVRVRVNIFYILVLCSRSLRPPGYGYQKKRFFSKPPLASGGLVEEVNLKRIYVEYLIMDIFIFL